MRRMKLFQEIAHGLFKAIRRLFCLNQWPVALHRGIPVGIQLFRQIESLFQGDQHVVEDGAAIARGKMDRTCREGRWSYGHRVLLEERLSPCAWNRLPAGSPSSTKAAQ